tara:strand:+ start:252 stop:374 length:123 start_codon:yes stop_codon:yes gene_type:complete
MPYGKKTQGSALAGLFGNKPKATKKRKTAKRKKAPTRMGY